MIVERGRGRDVHIRYRDEKGDRKVVKETNYWPYCFVETEHHELFTAVKKEDGYKGLYGEDLTKLVAADPSQIRDIKEQADSHNLQTWEANIPFVNRVLVDRLLQGETPIKNYKHRVWYLDCEWNPTTNAMRVITFYDTFGEKLYCLYINTKWEWDIGSNTTPGNRHAGEEILHQLTNGDITFIEYPNESSMLFEFMKFMDRQDPDVITGWYVTGADIKTLFERCNKNNLNPSGFSPYNRVRYGFGDWAQPIVGRMCIDLMPAFSKLWELKNGKLPGYKLDDVAQEVLGKGKVPLPDGHNTYHTDLSTYLDYAVTDVLLLPKLAAKVNAIDHYLSLQHLVQCDIKATPFITRMFSSLVAQDTWFTGRIPTTPQFDKVDYEGADVMEVKPGVYENVGILDVKAMYHSNAALHNISWETLYEIDPLTKEITDKHDLYLGALSDVNDFADCGNGTYFKIGEKGLLVRLMDKMTELRNYYKELLQREPDARWDAMQYACKSLVASMYGVAGDTKYGMYHPKIAAAITYTSRQTLDKLKEEAEKEGFKTLYGHTDSVFVEMPTPVEGEEKLVFINEEMAPIEVQFEKWCDRIILMAKNRYAGNVVWTDGVGHKDTLYVKGIEMKQARMPPIMKEAMSGVIEGILNGKDKNGIEKDIKELTAKVINGNAEPRSLCMKGKLTRNLQDYKVLSGPSAGAAWANEYLGKGYRSGSFFLTTLDENGKYIAFDDPEEIEGKYNIGYKHLAERFILKKVQPYYELMTWNMQPLLNTLNGVGDLVWF